MEKIKFFLVIASGIVLVMIQNLDVKNESAYSYVNSYESNSDSSVSVIIRYNDYLDSVTRYQIQQSYFNHQGINTISYDNCGRNQEVWIISSISHSEFISIAMSLGYNPYSDETRIKPSNSGNSNDPDNDNDYTLFFDRNCD